MNQCCLRTKVDRFRVIRNAYRMAYYHSLTQISTRCFLIGRRYQNQRVVAFVNCAFATFIKNAMRIFEG